MLYNKHLISLRKSLGQLTSNNNQGDFSRLIDIFEEVFFCFNMPSNRSINALKKAKLIIHLAQKILIQPKRSVKIELLSKIHKPTNTLTHNVVISFGNPKTGPNVVLMVHHDTIDFKNPELTFENGFLSGHSLLDDSIHLASVINSLDKITVPMFGSITIVFTDHEENGCRGSTAISKTLVSRFSTKFPIALIALEANSGNFAIGHRGKVNGEINLQTNNIINDFINFYSKLNYVENEIFKQSSRHSLLGLTSGTSTYGYINLGNFMAKIDIRTANIVTADKVLKIWNSNLISNSIDININSKPYSSNISRNKIILTSNSKITHPANFNPTNNQSILPFLYLTVLKIKRLGLESKIKEISWGDINKQNSIPLKASITGDFDIKKEIFDKTTTDVYINNNFRNINLSVKNTIITDSILSKVNNVTRNIAGKNLKTVNYMTDIGLIFSLLKKKNKNIYSFIYGIGNPKNLHGIEKVSVKDIIKLQNTINKLYNKIHNQLCQKYL